MTLRSCIVCGEPTSHSRCDDHRQRIDTQPSARKRGYSTSWDKLSRRARRMQPFCSDCGGVDDLTADHSTTAWERQEAGLPIRLDDIDVVCRSCNSRRGRARPTGDAPQHDAKGRKGVTHPGGSTVRAGPKAAVDPSPLPLGPTGVGAARVAAFVQQFIVVPKGAGALAPLVLRPWQLELVASVWGVEPRPRLAGWMLPRGQGKSTLVAALGLFDLMCGEEGASVVVAATDERQAGIVHGIATRMVELQPELSARVQVFRDRLVVPERGASFVCLPAEPKRLEGLDPTLAIIDEIGVVNTEVYEVVALAQGKRETSTLLGIGTPGPDPHVSVLSSMRDYARANPGDASFVWREHSAAAFTDHPVDCSHCWDLANPALGDFLHVDAMSALLPPKMREATFRRARLCQFVTDTAGAFLPEGVWDRLATGEDVPDGADVVLALDGSFNADATAVLVSTVAAHPHFDVAGLWEPPASDSDYRVPVAEVEDLIRGAARRWRVVEVVADPFRWTRTLQALEAEGLPVVEFPHSTHRLTPATTDLYQAAIAGELSHSGDADLARHVANAVVVEDARGVRLDKGKRSSSRRIDLAACAVMAHSRATWRATRKPTRRKVVTFR